ncbi:MAG: glycosyltransferase [Acidobacteria bacterium]|nr:glycosyltransferase [Acidobacteriota bacterium]
MARFCRYLPASGVRPVVLTVREEYAAKRDTSFAIPAGLQVERTSAGTNPLKWYGKWKRQLSPSSAAQGNGQEVTPGRPGYLRRNLLASLQTPDKFWPWYWPAVRAGGDLFKKQSFDLVFSSGPPWTSHLVARKLKSEYKTPWIADFRDAWVSDTWREAVPPWRDRVDRYFERECVADADLVVATTDALRDTFIRGYSSTPRSKFATLTNGFDDPPVLLGATQQSTSGKKVLLHLGDLYAGRRIDTFCAAMADLVNSGTLNPDGFKVLLIGNNDAEIVSQAEARIPELMRRGTLEFRAQVSWLEAQKLLDSADVLLIFQGDHRLAVPAKTYEYLQTGKPILALVQQGALSELLESTGSGFWAPPEDARQIAGRLMRAMATPRRSPAETERVVGRYHYRNLSAQLAGWVRELATNKS